MNKQELIKKISKNRLGWSIESIVNDVDAEGWLRNPGEPIDPKDIRKGDRLRVEHPNGDVYETVSQKTGITGIVGTKYFLLDRLKPELPTEPGAVVRMKFMPNIWTLDRNGEWRGDSYTVSPSWFDDRDWEVVVA